MNTDVKKKCLLICPLKFYSYSGFLKNAIEQKGYNVTVCNDEYPNNTIGKVMGKLRVPFLKYYTYKIFKKKFLDEKLYDFVLIIKGRGISKKLISEFKKISPRVIGYTFDSFSYHPSPKDWYPLMDDFYTFDYIDGSNHSIPIIELFSTIPQNTTTKALAYDVSVIVRNHSDRLKFIDLVLSNFTPLNRRYLYIYEQNMFTFFQNFLSSPKLYFKYRKYIFFKPLSFEDYYDTIVKSNFTIDYSHPKQSGITIRCFEALSTQTKIITNNSFIFKSNYFNDKNVVLCNKYNVSDANTTLKLLQIKDVLPRPRCRSINDFIADLIE